MQRSFLSFLDLITLFLCVMIVALALTSQQAGGKGLVKPESPYIVVSATYPKKTLTVDKRQPLAVAEDPQRAAVVMIDVGEQWVMLVSARPSLTSAQPAPEAAKVFLQPGLATIDCEWSQVSNEPPEPQKRHGEITSLKHKLLKFVVVPPKK